PYKDLWKLLHKDEVLSDDASWIFKFAPFIIFAVTLVIGASIPLLALFQPNMATGDMLVIIYMFAVCTFFLALAGMDTGSAFGGFGSSREMTLSALAEGGLIFSLLTLAIISRTGNLFGISHAVISAYGNSYLPILLAFSGFFIVLLAETARFPFDNPATHLELTMIHEAMILEYSGKRLALMEWASANKLLILSSMGANLFFPWGMANSLEPNAIFISVLAFAAKLLIFYSSIAVLESCIAKSRFFRLPNLLIISFILNVFAIGLVR
ncbi:MAG: NADH-quinone oxidoreductase subunit H, partial [Smithellaceae bacterium]|nr:NADH-quinone oxidoreductase subunit H [Smithellaceae bacterium]